MQGGSEVTLSAHATLTSTTTKQVWARPPIDVDFQVLMFTASGLIVRFLKVFEKSSYQSVKWVRYLTKASGSYQVRVSGFVVPLKNEGEIVLINVFWRSSEAYVHACISPTISLDIYQLFRAPLAQVSGKLYMIPSNPICAHRDAVWWLNASILLATKTGQADPINMITKYYTTKHMMLRLRQLVISIIYTLIGRPPSQSADRRSVQSTRCVPIVPGTLVSLCHLNQETEAEWIPHPHLDAPRDLCISLANRLGPWRQPSRSPQEHQSNLPSSGTRAPSNPDIYQASVVCDYRSWRA